MSGWPKKMSGKGDSPGQVRRFTGALIELSKVHLSLYIALSALAGNVLAAGRVTGQSLTMGGLVFLLAAGAGILNNIQDRHHDRYFHRTRHRVLPLEVFPLKWAWTAWAVLTGTALAGLYGVYDSLLPSGLGLVSLICYNGLYTPLKKKSLWAMVPGIVCGMIPPALGWAGAQGPAAGQQLESLPGLWILMACLGIWQLPHYLLVDGIGSKGIQGNGKGLTSGFNRLWPGIDRHFQVLIWTVLFCMGMMLFLFQGGGTGRWSFLVLFVLSLALPPLMAACLFFSRIRDKKWGFSAMNLSMLIFLSSVLLGRI